MFFSYVLSAEMSFPCFFSFLKGEKLLLDLGANLDLAISNKPQGLKGIARFILFYYCYQL